MVPADFFLSPITVLGRNFIFLAMSRSSKIRTLGLGQLPGFDVAPELFDRVQVKRIAGQLQGLPSIRRSPPRKVSSGGSGTLATREPDVSKLPILQNGPPGTSVVFQDGLGAASLSLLMLTRKKRSECKSSVRENDMN